MNVCEYIRDIDTIDRKTTGKYIKTAVVNHFGSVKEFCKVTGFYDTTVEKWMKGKRLPNVKVLLGISRMLNIPLDNLIRYKRKEGELAVLKDALNDPKYKERLAEFLVLEGFDESEVKSYLDNNEFLRLMIESIGYTYYGSFLEESAKKHDGEMPEDEEQDIALYTYWLIWQQFRDESYFLSYADVVLFAPFMHPMTFMDIMNRVIDYNNPAYVCRFFSERRIGKLTRYKEGRYVIRTLKKRLCPLVDKIELKRVSAGEEDEEAGAYLRLQKEYFTRLSCVQGDMDEFFKGYEWVL